RPGRKLLAKPGSSFDRVEDQLLATSQLSEVSSMDKAVDAILDGNAVLFIDGSRQAIILKVKGGIRRSVEEPETEAVIRGPREGFTENIRVNTSLLRFRVKTPDLKMINYIIGERTKTNV